MSDAKFKKGDRVVIRCEDGDEWSDKMGLVFTYQRSRRLLPKHVVLYPDGRTLEYAEQVKHCSPHYIEKEGYSFGVKS